MTQLWLNDYHVEEILGRGGMGTVVRARHARTDAPVALKLLTNKKATASEFVDAFHREIRAVAQLDHPNIAAILDTGIVEDVAPDFLVPVELGTPFYAMELVETGTLGDYAETLGWPELCALIEGVLDALAHAHACGIIHRDLKPGNILVVRDGDRLFPKLTDFGLADLVEQLDRSDSVRLTQERRVIGTPRYMAPEQILGQWRDQGPWTDLYALGCIVYRQIAGRLPFDGEPPHILRAHLADPIPPISRTVCPAPVQEWLGTLLEKSPHRRARHAANVLHGLRKLTNAGVRSPQAVMEDVATEAETAVFTSMTLPTSASDDVHADSPVPLDSLPRPPLPSSWRSQSLALRAGAATLYHLRPPRFVGREAQRTHLWDVLRTVVEEGVPRGVVIRGLAGSGKSRLAQWLSRRASEVGAVQAYAGHNHPGDPWAGIRAIVLAITRIRGLTPERALMRVQDWYAQRGSAEAATFYSCAILADLALGRMEHDTPEVFETLAQFFTLAAAERPLLLWFDDAHVSGVAITLTQRLLQLDAPLLVLCTAQSESLTAKPARADHLAELESAQTVVPMDLPPLNREEQRELVRQMLDLDTSLSSQIAERSNGNPLFAVQLVGHCIDRGVLVAGPHGYQLADDGDVVLPDQVRDAWISRLQECLTASGSDPDAGHRALEIAAALGQSVDLVEWFEATTAAGLTLRRALIHACVNRGLLFPADGGWSFAHALFRGTLEDHSRAQGRWQGQHRACAVALERIAQGRHVAPMRIARHFVAAGAHTEALPHLLAAANISHPELLDEVVDLLSRADGAESRDSAILCEALQAYLAMFRSGRREGLLLAEQAFAQLPQVSQPGVGAVLYRVRTLVELQGGSPEACRALATEALAYAEASGDEELLPVSRRLLAITLLHGGWVHEAFVAAEAFVASQDPDAAPEMRIKGILCLSQAAVQIGQFDRALAVVDEGLQIARAMGSRMHAGDLLRIKATCHRTLGQLDEALHCWQETLDIHDGGPAIMYSWWEVELGLIAVARGDDEDAARWFEEFFLDERNPNIGDYVAAALELARIHLQRGDSRRWDELLGRCDLFVTSGRVLRDVAVAADHAARAADALGEGKRAKLARAIAAQQWSRLQGAGVGSALG